MKPPMEERRLQRQFQFALLYLLTFWIPPSLRQMGVPSASSILRSRPCRPTWMKREQLIQVVVRRILRSPASLTPWTGAPCSRLPRTWVEHDWAKPVLLLFLQGTMRPVLKSLEEGRFQPMYMECINANDLRPARL